MRGARRSRRLIPKWTGFWASPAAWGNSGAPSWTIINPSPFGSSTPYRVDESQPGAVAIGGVQVAWGGLGLHNFLEVTIAVDGASEDVLTNQFGGLGIHWTEGCGNDVIDVRDDTPFVPVPEPATLPMMACGLAVILGLSGARSIRSGWLRLA